MNNYVQLYQEIGSGGPAGGGGDSSATSSASAASSAAGSILAAPAGAPAGSGDSGNGQGNAGAVAAGSENNASGGKAGQVQEPVTGQSWFHNLYDAQGKLDKTKFDQLPAHLKGYKELFSKYNTMEALMGGFANSSSLNGKKGLAPLPPESSPEAKAERAKLMAQLQNTPEKPEGYGFKKPDHIPDTHWSQEYATGVAGILHKHQASPELAKELMDFDNAHSGKLIEQAKAGQTAAAAAEIKALRDEWGNDYAKNIELATRGAQTLGFDPKDGFFAQAKAVKLVAKFASMISEDRLVTGASQGLQGGASSDRDKALDIVNNPANPMNKAYHDPTDPRHQQAVEAHSTFNKSYLAKMKGLSKA